MAYRSSSPTMHFVLHHHSAYLRRCTFESMNFIAKTREALLRGDCDDQARATALALIRRACEKAREANTDAAKHGFRLP